MKRFFHLLVILGGFFLAPTAQAESGFFLEPMVTYQNLKADITYPNTFLSDSSGEVKGIGLGLRAGGHVLDTIFLAADLRYAQPRYKDSNFEADAKATNYGVVLGVQMPIAGLRLWATYIVDGNLDPKEDNNVDLKFTEAHGQRFGAGLHVATFSVNLEYQNVKYGSTELEKLGPFTNISAQDNIDLTEKGFVASVSFPISF
ncbi:hypothetical protein CIK05_12035 [Bdellovibrio sp. qaytius]|nr:hypothetical protein CIK05_12035 [Bdellovibrio sp. qaytius]